LSVQLEEGKVKTGASAHPETKERNSEDGNKYLEINMLDTSIENQTQLNFTAGIGTMDYSAVSLNNSDVQGSRLSAKEEFLNRIQNEDPLEGPSWRFQSDSTPTGRKGTKSKPVISYQFIKKVITVKHLYSTFQRTQIIGFCCIEIYVSFYYRIIFYD
jgi:hypothetical protein